MSLIHADNFSIYGGSTAEMTADGRYSEVVPGFGGGIVADPDGVSTPKVFLGAGGDAAHLRRPLVTPTHKVGIAFRLWAISLPAIATENALMPYWRDAGNNPVGYLWLETTGAISFRYVDNVGATHVLYTTPGPVVTAGVWWHIEAAFDANAKTFVMKVEGVTKINLAAGDFPVAPLSATIYQCGSYSSATNTGAGINSYIKDYVWWDDQGTQNIDFLGAVLVAQLDPVSDVTVGGWVPSTGATAFNILDQDPADAPYLNADSTPPAALEVNLSDLPANVSSVKGLITIVRAKKTDGGDGQLQTSLKSSGTTGNGANRPITTANADWEDIFELDPHTAAPWIPAAVNLATMLIHRTL